MSAARKSRQKNNRGFTLIELALVAVIILAIVSLSAPLFRETISDLTLRDTSYNIAKLINYAQERAVVDNKKNYKIKFTIEKNQYQLFEYSVAPDAAAVTEKRLSDKFGKLYKLPRGITFVEPESGRRPEKIEVLFYPDGHCTAARINLFDARGKHYEIATKGFGGIVRVKEIEEK